MWWWLYHTFSTSVSFSFGSVVATFLFGTFLANVRMVAKSVWGRLVMGLGVSFSQNRVWKSHKNLTLRSYLLANDGRKMKESPFLATFFSIKHYIVLVLVVVAVVVWLLINVHYWLC